MALNSAHALECRGHDTHGEMAAPVAGTFVSGMQVRLVTHLNAGVRESSGNGGFYRLCAARCHSGSPPGVTVPESLSRTMNPTHTLCAMAKAKVSPNSPHNLKYTQVSSL